LRSAVPSPPNQDAADTYLPAFDACIRAARTQGVMCAYNAVDGVPMCANKPKLQGLLRDKWGFDGYVVSDCNAVQGLVWGHKTARDEPAAIAQAIKAGTDLLCDNMDSQKVGRGREAAVLGAKCAATRLALLCLQELASAFNISHCPGVQPTPSSAAIYLGNFA
jgi:beta-glucosidase-like glycosyl hydrolase